MIEITQEEIIKNWNVDDTDNPLVSIRCVTYNHEPYIAQALDGFLMQKTSFPFEVIVHDDASTDKTAEIIREYEIKFPKIIKPIYETENQYSKHDGSLSRIMDSACKGKYIALCEGDDYWIDENKLQLQVDFLEKNSEYGMCYTKVRNYFQKESRFTNSWGGNAESYKEMLYRNLLLLYSFILLFSTLSILLTGGNIKKNSFDGEEDNIPDNYVYINFNDFASSYIACFCLIMINNLNILVKSLTFQTRHVLFFEFYFATFYFFSTLILINIIQTLLLELYLISDYSLKDSQLKLKEEKKAKNENNEIKKQQKKA